MRIDNTDQAWVSMLGYWPSRVALYEGESSYTYLKIDHESSIVAQFLKQQGVGEKHRVILCLENSYAFIVAFWAIIKTSATVVIVNPNYDEETLNIIQNDIRPIAIFAMVNNPLIEKRNAQRQRFKREKYICLINSRSDECYTWSELFSTPNRLSGDSAETDETTQKLPTSDPKLLPSSESEAKTHIIRLKDKAQDSPFRHGLALIIYTSGSSGAPKGIMLSYRNIAKSIAAIQSYLKYQAHDKILCSLPLSFDYGLYQMLLAYTTGASLVLAENSALPHCWSRSIHKHQISIFPMVPRMVDLMNDAMLMESWNSVRLLTFTGDKLRRHHVDCLRDFFPNSKICAMYGLTECKRCSYIPFDKLDEKIDSVGRIIPDTDAWIEDEHGNVLNPGQCGELVLRTERTMMGYWNNESLTSKRIQRCHGEQIPRLYTGDYCSLDEDAYIYYHGRITDVIIHQGHRLSLVALENLIFNGEVKEISILARRKNSQYELDCFVVLKKNGRHHVLSESVHRILSGYRLNYRLLFLPALPRTLNGKVDTKSLRIANESNISINSNIKD